MIIKFSCKLLLEFITSTECYRNTETGFENAVWEDIHRHDLHILSSSYLLQAKKS